jgi:hypothetical protein
MSLAYKELRRDVMLIQFMESPLFDGASRIAGIIPDGVTHDEVYFTTKVVKTTRGRRHIRGGVPGMVGFIDYRVSGEVVKIHYTNTTSKARNQGVFKTLLGKILEDVMQYGGVLDFGDAMHDAVHHTIQWVRGVRPDIRIRYS